MGDPKGFIAIRRQDPRYRPVAIRVTDWLELVEPLHAEVIHSQGSRCMDCGVPFCQSSYGCPVQNLIPDFNDLAYRRRWREALKSLHGTNNFPEFTGRLCPAPCESACVLGITDLPVTIKAIEKDIVDRGWEKGWIRPVLPVETTGKRVAIVGSGPAGLAAAQQLRRAGHAVTVFEKADRAGGLLRYGIPDFKMEKHVLDRRLNQLVDEGVEFRCGVEAGRDVGVEELKQYDAVLLAMGAMVHRDIDAPGRDLPGVHPAMEYLEQQNRVGAGDTISEGSRIDAQGLKVLVIGGGDTGSDCAGTAIRQGAASVHQVEILPRPPDQRSPETPWPKWPNALRTSHSHEEGCTRDWSVQVTAFEGERRVQTVHASRLAWKSTGNGRRNPAEIPGSGFTIEADLVLLAMGFTGPRVGGLIKDLGTPLDKRGAIATDHCYRTGVPKVFAAGDAHRGASLVVWAIREGRDAAKSIDHFLRRGGAWPA